MSSEYGWSKSAILEETYLDEALILLGLIRNRRNSQYKILLAISENPHREKPEALWNALNGETREDSSTELDKNGLEFLKLKMSDNPRMLIK